MDIYIERERKREREKERESEKRRDLSVCCGEFCICHLKKFKNAFKLYFNDG